MTGQLGTVGILGHFACESRRISGHFGGIGGIVDVRGEAKRGYGKRRFGDCFLPHAVRSLHDAHSAHDALAAAVDGWFLAP